MTPLFLLLSFLAIVFLWHWNKWPQHEEICILTVIILVTMGTLIILCAWSDAYQQAELERSIEKMEEPFRELNQRLGIDK